MNCEHHWIDISTLALAQPLWVCQHCRQQTTDPELFDAQPNPTPAFSFQEHSDERISPADRRLLVATLCACLLTSALLSMMGVFALVAWLS